jgi:hypothetical protein
VIWLKVPAGGAAWPRELSPQQAGVPSVLTAQVWKPPEETSLNVPAGGVAWPDALSPQQASVPSVLIAQAKLEPEETFVKVPAGGADWPKVLSPQQTRVASILIPQVKFWPAEIALELGTATTVARPGVEAGEAALAVEAEATRTRPPITTSVTSRPRINRPISAALRR